MGTADTLFHFALFLVSLGSVVGYIRIYKSIDWKVIEYKDPRNNETRATFQYGIDRYCKINSTGGDNVCMNLTWGQKPFPIGQIASAEALLGTLSERDSREVVQVSIPIAIIYTAFSGLAPLTKLWIKLKLTFTNPNDDFEEEVVYRKKTLTSDRENLDSFKICILILHSSNNEPINQQTPQCSSSTRSRRTQGCTGIFC